MATMTRFVVFFAAAQVALSVPALAQSSASDPAPAEAEAATPPADLPEIDWSRLGDLDALTLLRGLPSSDKAPRPLVPSDSIDWARTENKNGSANVARKRAWGSGISTNVGVDGAAAQPGWEMPGAASAPSSGTAWASASIPGTGLIDQATIDARMDPNSDQRKFGARFEKSIPLNQQMSVTVQNGYGLSQPLVSQTIAGAAAPAQVFDTEQQAKLNLLNSGTSLFATSRQSSADDRRLNAFGAEQNLFDGWSVSGTVSENAAGGHDRSLSARFRRAW